MIKEKRKLFVDADGTLINLIAGVVAIYNEDFANYPNFKPINWFEIETWGFEELTLTTKKEIYKHFDTQRLFDKMEFLENAKEVITRLSEHFDIYIVTMGTKKNLKLKEVFFKTHLPFATFIGCDVFKHKNKKHVDMSGGIFIDDRADNLENSNAEIKIVYGDLYEWNCRWLGKRFFNWHEIEKYLA